jgi:hypothetical protein
VNFISFRANTEERKARHWRVFQRERERLYRTIAVRTAATLRRQTNQVADAISARSNKLDLEYYAGREVDGMEGQIEALMAGTYVDVGRRFGNMTIDSFKAFGLVEVKYETNTFVRIIQAFVAREFGERIKSINTVTKEKISRVIRQGIEANQSVQQIARDIKSGAYLQSIIPNRALVIARTEVIAASNYGSQVGAKLTGLTLEKEWLSTRDSRTRDDHVAADGERVLMDDTYTQTGEELRFPGDPAGSPGNVIQCRCTETYEPID